MKPTKFITPLFLQEITRLIEQHGFDRSLVKNPYTDLGGNEIRRKWQEVQGAVPRRDGQLNKELQRQQSRLDV